MSHRVVAGVATHCSPSVRPLTGHPHVVWLTHAHSATVHGRLRCPFFMFAPFPLRARSVPPRSPAAQLARPARPGWAARHMRLLLSRPRHPRDVHAVGAGAASVHVVGARRRSGACSLPIAPAREFPLCCGGGLSPGVLCRVHATGGEGCVRSGRHRPQKRARSAPSRRLPLTVV